MPLNEKVPEPPRTIHNETERERLEAEMPPTIPGYEHDEELRRRKDQLEQAAETQANAQEVFTLDARAFEIENEIAQHFNALEVSDKQAGFRYCWVNYVTGNGRYVQYKLANRVKGKGSWEVVRGDDPEARELKAPDGTRRIGDVLLMRIPEDTARVLEHMDRLRWEAMEGSVTSNLHDVAAKARAYGARVWEGEEVPEHMLKRMHNKAQSRRTGQRMMDQWMRQGRMPGTPAPGSR